MLAQLWRRARQEPEGGKRGGVPMRSAPVIPANTPWIEHTWPASKKLAGLMHHQSYCKELL
ncbi:hypothetical protein SSCG_06076 [Streptomyces clavuligerus]|nr:hypothetical protein SSCG_06076 [Streptomyces clavuligerus]